MKHLVSFAHRFSVYFLVTLAICICITLYFYMYWSTLLPAVFPGQGPKNRSGAEYPCMRQQVTGHIHAHTHAQSHIIAYVVAPISMIGCLCSAGRNQRSQWKCVKICGENANSRLYTYCNGNGIAMV